MMLDLVRLLAFCFSIIPLTEGSSCDAPPVSAGHPANISCYFNENVQVTKKNVKVQKSPRGMTTFEPDVVQTVVECFWSDVDTFKCDIEDGYKLQGKITDRATFGIPTSSKTFEGRYMCEAVPSDPADIQACELYVHEGPDGININLSVSDLRPVEIAILVVAVLILLVVVFAMVMFFGRERLRTCLSKCRKKKPDGTQEEEIPMFKRTHPEDLKQIVEDAVKIALLKVAETDVGVHIMSTMHEINKQSQLKPADPKTIKQPPAEQSAVGTPSDQPKPGPAAAPEHHYYVVLADPKVDPPKLAPTGPDPKMQGNNENQATASKQEAEKKLKKAEKPKKPFYSILRRNVAK